MRIELLDFGLLKLYWTIIALDTNLINNIKDTNPELSSLKEQPNRQHRISRYSKVKLVLYCIYY